MNTQPILEIAHESAEAAAGWGAGSAHEQSVNAAVDVSMAYTELKIADHALMVAYDTAYKAAIKAARAASFAFAKASWAATDAVEEFGDHVQHAYDLAKEADALAAKAEVTDDLDLLLQLARDARVICNNIGKMSEDHEEE